MSRFGFVTPNDPPRASGPPNHAKTSRRTLPGPKKCPGKSLRPRGSFQNWKARSRIKRSPNKLGCKWETAERSSNPVNPESISSLDLQETALRCLLIFRYRWTTQKSQLGDVLKFLGSRHAQKKCFSPQHSRINFRCRTLPRIFDVRLKFACALITWFMRISRKCAYTRFFQCFSKNIAATFLGNFSSQF